MSGVAPREGHGGTEGAAPAPDEVIYEQRIVTFTLEKCKNRAGFWLFYHKLVPNKVKILRNRGIFPFRAACGAKLGLASHSQASLGMLEAKAKIPISGCHWLAIRPLRYVIFYYGSLGHKL